jgi:N-formylglutamate amidohydrolase
MQLRHTGNPLVLHIPHASRVIPPDVREHTLLNETELAAELLAATDAYTDELFPITQTDAARVCAQVSRLVCDVERFASDIDEPMSRLGRGVIYERTSCDRQLRHPPGRAMRTLLLDAYYHPHHTALTTAVAGALDRAGNCIIVDCHSYASKAQTLEPAHGAQRPDICLGTDPLHTPEWLIDRLIRAVRASGLSVALNEPYSGSIVPLTYYRQDQRVQTIMIEVRRDLYMDEQTGRRAPTFNHIQSLLATWLRNLESPAL